jgi:Ca-activated chloride channel family protein
MHLKRFRGLALLVTILGLTTLACGIFQSEGPPRNAIVVDVAANGSLEAWLASAVMAFNEAEVETSEGKQIYAQIEAIESGQAVTDFTEEDVSPSVWIPDSEVWTRVLADRGNANYTGDCVSVVTSPLVIAMWRPLAESLGWPGLPIGWLDVGSLAADPSAWNYYSGGEYGDALRLGHSHPGLSGSGASTLLAVVQAAQSKSDAVTVDEIQQPIVQASVSAFEAAVSTFSASANELGQAMVERGIPYLGAAVLYESDVVSNSEGEIVPIYPLEGTYVANHPACINSAADDEKQEAAIIFRDYLLDEEAQLIAQDNGLRPVNANIPTRAPLDEAHGVSLEEPQKVFSEPSVDAIYAAQDLWQSARKDVNLIMLLDVSGSMRGNKVDSMREAAIQFVNQMGDDDFITIIAFSHELRPIATHAQVGPFRQDIVSAIAELSAEGDTALYDAIGEGAAAIANTTEPDTTNAMVVLTDGQDTYSYRYDFDQELIDLASDNDTTVFTIAYGGDADRDVLSGLAFGANGNFYTGDEASISAIYDEMSAAFGGSAGIGR